MAGCDIAGLKVFFLFLHPAIERELRICRLAGRRYPRAVIEGGEQFGSCLGKCRQLLRRNFARIEIFGRGRFAAGSGEGAGSECFGIAEIALGELFTGQGGISVFGPVGKKGLVGSGVQ
ncbi:MAG: hypothetical protein ACKVH1_05285 [Alphaproteobacteria bacterium]